MPFGSNPRSRDELRTQVEKGNLMISLGPIDWGIEVSRTVVAELSEVRPTRT